MATLVLHRRRWGLPFPAQSQTIAGPDFRGFDAVFG